MASPLYHKYCSKCGTATEQLGQYCRNCGNCVLGQAEEDDALSYKPPSLVKHTDALPGSFSPYSGCFEIEEQAQTITITKKGGNAWATAWMTDPMKISDICYFEVELKQNLSGCLGFIQKPEGFMASGSPLCLTHLHGDDGHCGKQNGVWTCVLTGAGNFRTTPAAGRPGPAPKAKDKLGFLVDFFSNRIILYVNGKRHGTMCSGIREIKGGIVFALSVSAAGHAFIINRDAKLPPETEQLRRTLQAQQDFIERACGRLELKAREVRQLKQAREIDEATLQAAIKERDALRRRLAEFEAAGSTASEPQFAPKASATTPESCK